MPRPRIRPLSFGKVPRFTLGVFRFPGSFHPPLVQAIMAAHLDADVVGDPMVGGGTTAILAAVGGRDAVVADIDPLACLVTRAAVSPVDPDALRALLSMILDDAGPLGYAVEAVHVREVIEQLEGSTAFRAPPNVFHWFHPTVARDLSRILISAHDVLNRRPRAERDAVFAVLASTIRRVSRADPKPVSGLEVTSVQRARLAAGLRFDLAAEIRNRTEALACGYEQMLDLPRLGHVQVRCEQVRRWSDLCRRLGRAPSLQILSPPYLQAIEYWRRHRLEYFWLGLVRPEEYVTFSRRFIGAKAIRNGLLLEVADGLPSEVMHIASSLADMGYRHDALVLRQYFMDAVVWLRQLHSAASSAGGSRDVYVVIGPSRMRSLIVDTPELVGRLAEEVGLTLIHSSRHLIINRRMNFPLRNGPGIKTETVLHFQA